MKQKLLLGSCIDQVIGKATFLFEKPLSDLKIVCIPTAANVYEDKEWLHQEMGAFQTIGIQLIVFDLVGQNEQDVADMIKDADAVYVTGGNTYYLLEHMQKCNFKTIITSYLEKGGLYIGSSAGTVVTCPTIEFIADMDDPAEASLTNLNGLHLVEVNILPHFGYGQYAAQAQSIVEQASRFGFPLIGLKDNQALLVVDDCIEIIS